MSAKYTALVAGGFGVIGRQLVDHLAGLPDWEVIGLSRRDPGRETGANYISVDLADRQDVIAKLGDFTEVTHIFFAAYQEKATASALIDTHMSMLRNLVSTVHAASRSLKRVVLYQGAKYYGAHLGSFVTPARESDPRHMPPDFYYDMEDWLLSEAQKKSWDVVTLRPDVVCGFAPGNPMNLSMLIAVYASISKELGLPLRFPGTGQCYGKLAQVTEAVHLARGSVWAALEASGGESYNLTNGDLFRWSQLWSAIADYFDMPLAEPQTLSLVEFMADKAPVWQHMVNKYGLLSTPYEEVAAWGFGDFIFRCDWDVIMSTTKIRQAGFHEVVDSISMFLRLLNDFQGRRAIPDFNR